MNFAWASPEVVATMIAGIFGITGALAGGALGLWGSYRLQRISRKEERNRFSYAIFAGLIATQKFLEKLLEMEVCHPSFQIRRLAAIDFYWKVLEANLGNLGTLGASEAIMLCDIYADLKVIHGRCVSLITIVDNDDVGLE